MKTFALAAFAASALLALPAQAGTLLDAYSAFSIQGNNPGVGAFDSGPLTPTTSFATPFQADGLAYQGGQVFASGVTSGGFLSGGYLKSYDLAGAETGSVYGGSFVQWGPLAAGNDMLFAGTTSFSLSGSEFSINFYNADLTGAGVSIELPEVATGVAFTGGGLFVSYGSTLAHYDLTGNLIDSNDYAVFDITALAYGGGKVFLGIDDGSSHGWASVNPALLWASGGASVTLDDAVTGLAYGDGGLFVSTEFSLAKYDLAGNQTNLLNTGPVVSNGPLAFIPGTTGPRDGAVPEPSTWALLILGFGVTGVSIRSKRSQLVL